MNQHASTILNGFNVNSKQVKCVFGTLLVPLTLLQGCRVALLSGPSDLSWPRAPPQIDSVPSAGTEQSFNGPSVAVQHQRALHYPLLSQL